MPNPTLLDKMQNSNINAMDVVYHHLASSYDSVSTKTKVKKIESPNYRICSFSQEFDHKIEFETESCEVSEGLNMRVKFPKVSKSQVIEWIELMNESMSTGIPNKWNRKKTEFKPSDDQMGCYYELIKANNQWNIIIWCGT